MNDDDRFRPEGEDGLLGRVRLRRSDAGAVQVVKSLDHARASDADEFRRRFEALTRLDHPHLVHYVGIESLDEPIQIVAEHVDGADLLSYLRRAPTASEIRAVHHRFESERPNHPPPETEETEQDSAESTESDGHDPPPPPPAEESERNGSPPADAEGGGEVDEVDLAPPAAEKSGEAEEADDREDDFEPADELDEDVLEGPSFPEVHTYAEAGIGNSESSDVVVDPEPDLESDRVELIDVVFLRLERLMPLILGALEYLHRFRTPHGALKPTNILVDATGRCALSDFGLRSLLELAEAEDAEETDGAITPPDETNLDYAKAYLAPECRENFETSPKADLYALGCVLFEAITGCRPYRWDPATDEEPAGESQQRRRISEELDAVEHLEGEADGEQSPASEASDPNDPDPTPPPLDERRYELRASALSELEPRCPAAWADLIIRLLDPDPERRPDFEEIRELLASSRGRSVDIPPSFIPEQKLFFGRDEIFDRVVEDAQACVAAESLQVSILTGPAGYGKTAIGERLAHWAAQRGWVLLRGRCYDQDALLYQGWKEIAAQLGELCRSAMGELDEATEELRRHAGRLFSELSTTVDDDLSIDRLEAVEALRELLKTLSEERPILLFFDNLDWASWDTGALLADVIAEPEGLQCMVVGTWRTGDEGPKKQRLRTEFESAPVEIDWVSVRGFNSSEADAFVASIADLERSQRETVLELGGDNPLLLEELVHQLYLDRDESSATNVETTETGTDEEPETTEVAEPPAEAELPPELEELKRSGVSESEMFIELLRGRLDELTRQQTFVVQLLSVASVPLPERVLSAAVDREFHTSEGMGQSLGPLFKNLRTRRLVREVTTERWNHAFTLFHNLSRDLILEEIHDQHYTHLCDHLAETLRQLWPDAKELHFEYLLRADRLSEALDSAVRAARNAHLRFAYHRAAGLWRWIAEQSSESTRFTTLQPREELAHNERLAGRPQRAAPLYHELSEGLPPGAARSKFQLDEFETLLEAGHRRQALGTLERALQSFGERYARPHWLQKLSEWKNRAVAATNRWSDEPENATHDSLGGRMTLQLRLYRQIILKNDVLASRRGAQFRAKFSAMAERSRDALLLGYDRLFLARDCHYYGISQSPERADDWYDETEKLFETSDDAYGLAQTAVGRARLLRNRGEFDGSEQWLQKAKERLSMSAPDVGRERYSIDYEQALLAQERGELERALRRAYKLRHFYRGNALARFRAAQVLVPVHLLRGELRRVEVLVDECESFLEGEPPCVGTAWLARQSTRLNLALDRPEVAQGRLNVLEEQLRGSGLMPHPFVHLALHASQAQALIALISRKTQIGESRRDDLFGEVKDSIDEIRRRSPNLVPPLESEIERLFARFEMLRGNQSEAYRHLDAALEVLAGYPNPIARSMCAEARGLAFQREDSEQGTSLVEQSRVIYDHHDCHFPLVLEGWPVPERMAKLRPDPEE